MTVWFVNRHPGALEWMLRSGKSFDRHVEHLDPNEIQSGDTVIGSLPINLAAEVCARGAEYWHLSLWLDSRDRGCELSAIDLQNRLATLERFAICKLP
jgi:CRISPR-associated protein Csx16